MSIIRVQSNSNFRDSRLRIFLRPNKDRFSSALAKFDTSMSFIQGFIQLQKAPIGVALKY